MTSNGVVLEDAVAELRAARGDRDVVITTMGAARAWMAQGPLHPLDFVLVPSAMGGAPSLGLGLALARPDRRVIVVNGDGSMLMSLGALVTITAEEPANLAVVVCDNGVYEVTGAQPTPGAPAGRVRRDRVDFETIARGAGFRDVIRCADLAAWRASLPTVLGAAGPLLVVLDVVPNPAARGPRSPGPAAERARAFMEALAASDSRTAGGDPPPPAR